MRRQFALVGATLLSAVALAACGGSSSGLLPPSNANALGTDLSALSAGLSNHSCAAVDAALGRIDTDIFDLPSSVDKRLRDNLVQGYEVLDNHARSQCEASSKPAHHTGSHSTGPSGATHATGTSTGLTGPTLTTTGSGGTTTGSSGTTTGGSSGTVGSGGGVQAPTGGSGTTGTTGTSDGGTAGA